MAITYGMSSKEFWEDDPDLLWAYRLSYIDKIKIQAEKENYNAWLHGLYVYDAVWKSIYNEFGREKGKQALSYIEKPYDFNEKPKSKEEIEKEQRLEVERQIKERNNKIKEMLNKNKVGEIKG